MPPKTLAQSGAAIILAAVLLFWGTGRWLNTRTSKPVGMTISLDAGRIQTGDFGVNLREKFQVYILLDPSIDDYWTDGRRNFDSLPEMNWKVFQLPNQERSEFWLGSESRRSSEGYVGEFHAVPGTYRFELQISQATRCLNARHPHLQISTPSRDYAEIYKLPAVSLVVCCGFRCGSGVDRHLRMETGAFIHSERDAHFPTDSS
jgi:hypothetical protein